jgi:hypothetical protein
MFHIKPIDVFMISAPIVSSVITINQKTVYTFYMAAILFLTSYKNCDEF